VSTDYGQVIDVLIEGRDMRRHSSGSAMSPQIGDEHVPAARRRNLGDMIVPFAGPTFRAQ
jgi:hypothetical protein